MPDNDFWIGPKAARTELDSQSEIKDAPTRAEKADGSL